MKTTIKVFTESTESCESPSSLKFSFFCTKLVFFLYSASFFLFHYNQTFNKILRIKMPSAAGPTQTQHKSNEPWKDKRKRHAFVMSWTLICPTNIIPQRSNAGFPFEEIKFSWQAFDWCLHQNNITLGGSVVAKRKFMNIVCGRLHGGGTTVLTNRLEKMTGKLTWWAPLFVSFHTILSSGRRGRTGILRICWAISWKN